MKIGVDAGPLSDDRREAGARRGARAQGDGPADRGAHRQRRCRASRSSTSLEAGRRAAVSVHLGSRAERTRTRRVHARAAARGAWVEFDGIAEESVDRHVDARAADARPQGASDRVLVSHDAGWYHVGEPGRRPVPAVRHAVHEVRACPEGRRRLGGRRAAAARRQSPPRADGPDLVACPRSTSTPRGRGIPAGGVAPPSHTPGILSRRALPSGRRAPRFWSLFNVDRPLGIQTSDSLAERLGRSPIKSESRCAGRAARPSLGTSAGQERPPINVRHVLPVRLARVSSVVTTESPRARPATQQ